jgi:hypothetical protein
MASATATVKGGFWEQYSSSLTQISSTSAAKKRASHALAQKGQMSLRERMETLNGATAGSAASKVLARIVAAEELGGVRAIENETLVSANTAAADVTEINEDILALSTRTTFGSSPVANGDGNPLGTR